MSESRYQRLHDEAVAASGLAHFSRAEVLFGEAAGEARRRGLQHLADRAACNRAAMAIERGDAGQKGELSRILGGSSDLKARQLAAYSLGAAYRNSGQLAAAQLYGRMSVQLSRHLGHRTSEASSLHFLGLTHLAGYQLAEARWNLEASIELRLAAPGGEVETERAGLSLSALGYCLSLTGDHAATREALQASRTCLDRRQSPVYEPSVHLSCGFAHLEMGDLDEALAHGQAVLDMEGGDAELGDDPKYAYYLVGEVWAQRGSARRARDYFEVLGKNYYPAIAALPDFLLSCGTASLVNWLG